MMKEFKISVIIFIIFTLIFLGSLKLKPPTFVTQTDKIIAELSLAEIEFKERVLFSYNSVNNPFESSKIVNVEKESKEALPSKESPLPIVSFIYEGRYKYAVIGNSIVKEGDTINGYQIKSIFKDRVLVQNRQGETKWLRLENY